MILPIKINGQSHRLIIINLCSRNGYSDYEGIVINELTLNMASVVGRVKAMGFQIDAWNNQLCLAQNDHLYLTIYPSGRIIIERVPGNDPNDSLPYFQKAIGFGLSNEFHAT